MIDKQLQNDVPPTSISFCNYDSIRNEIVNTNSINGIHDIIEVYTSHKNNNQYLISPNFNDYNLDIYLIEDNKKILSLKGHKINIISVK
jgi:hypothetical protein